SPSKGADRQTPADDLPETGQIRVNRKTLLRAPWSETEPGHHLIKYQQRIIFVANLSEEFKEPGPRQIKSRIAWNRFHNDARDLARIRPEDLSNSVLVIER